MQGVRGVGDFSHYQGVWRMQVRVRVRVRGQG